MIDLRQLQIMYQQWCNGQEQVVFLWAEFIEFAAKQTRYNISELESELKKTRWFEWPQK